MPLILQKPYGLDASTSYRKLDLFARNLAAYQADIGYLSETNAGLKQSVGLWDELYRDITDGCLHAKWIA
jgi:hypothetical protein